MLVNIEDGIETTKYFMRLSFIRFNIVNLLMDWNDAEMFGRELPILVYVGF